MRSFTSPGRDLLPSCLYTYIPVEGYLVVIQTRSTRRQWAQLIGSILTLKLLPYEKWHVRLAHPSVYIMRHEKGGARSWLCHPFSPTTRSHDGRDLPLRLSYVVTSLTSARAVMPSAKVLIFASFKANRLSNGPAKLVAFASVKSRSLAARIYYVCGWKKKEGVGRSEPWRGEGGARGEGVPGSFLPQLDVQ